MKDPKNRKKTLRRAESAQPTPRGNKLHLQQQEYLETNSSMKYASRTLMKPWMPYNSPNNYFDKNNVTLAGSETKMVEQEAKLSKKMNSKSVLELTKKDSKRGFRAWGPTSCILRPFQKRTLQNRPKVFPKKLDFKIGDMRRQNLLIDTNSRLFMKTTSLSSVEFPRREIGKFRRIFQEKNQIAAI